MSSESPAGASGGVAAEPFRILTVCTANICRSPMAEHLLRDALAMPGGPSGATFDVSSAGVRGWDDAVMDPGAVVELRRLGGDPTDFRARSLTAAHIEVADLVLTATMEHRAYVLAEVPRALRRTFTLLELAHLIREVPSIAQSNGPRDLVAAAAAARGSAQAEEYDVMDPYGGSPERHRQVADTVHAAVLTIANGLQTKRLIP